MRNAILLACTLLASVPVIASTINVRATSLSVMSPLSVRAKCGVVDTACTVFRDAELSCACEFKHGRWAASVAITAQPETYTSDPKFVAHEMAHILDFNMAMRKHADGLEDRAFRSLAACEAFADRAQEDFVEVLREYLRASTLLRDHRLADRE